MIQVGIFTGYFPYSLPETAKKIRSLGFNTVQLDLAFKDMDLSTSAITRDKCRTIRETFPTTTCRSAPSAATPTSSTPTPPRDRPSWSICGR